MAEIAPLLDLTEAHRHFSTSCFNATWELMERRGRTPAEDDAMIQMAQASLWHWTQRDDVTETNLTVGYWLLSRAYCLVHRPQAAQDAAVRSLAHAAGEDPFYRGYAHEALARAALLAGELPTFTAHLAEARYRVAEVSDEDDRSVLAADLDQLVELHQRRR